MHMSSKRIQNQALLLLCVGLTCALVVVWTLSSSAQPPKPDVLESDHDLEKMQTEVHRQLVEAAKRRALAKKHREQALKLAYKAAEDRITATILKRKAVFAKKEAVLEKDEKATESAENRVKEVKAKSARLDAAADKDVAQALSSAPDPIFSRLTSSDCTPRSALT
jgi:membrane protein involved in colicin uptake